MKMVTVHASFAVELNDDIDPNDVCLNLQDLSHLEVVTVRDGDGVVGRVTSFETESVEPAEAS